MNKVEILAQELAKPEYQQFGQDYEAIRDYLNNKPLIPNPTPQGNIPKPLDILEIAQAITPQESKLIYRDYPRLKADVDHAILTNDRPNLSALLAVASSEPDPILSAQSVANIQALIDLEIPDPSWRSHIEGISKAEELNIYPVTEHEIQAALNPLTILEGDPDAFNEQ